MKKLSVLVIGLCLACSPAQKFDRGLVAYESGDFEKAFRVFHSFAEQGFAVAQYNLGVMYDRGEGTTQNYREAMKWYRHAAKQGHTSAQYNLGIMYTLGDGVPQNYPEAAKWFTKAGMGGYTSAQYNLGVMYRKGEGVPKDEAEAFTWFNMASPGILGHSEPLYCLVFVGDEKIRETRDTIDSNDHLPS